MLTPLKAIRLKCRKCVGGQSNEIKDCGIEDCPLFIYRLGHNPARRGIGGGLKNFRRNLPTQVARFEQEEAL